MISLREWQREQDRRSPDGVVYLIHFTQPYRHARHYLGWSSDVPERLKAHANGNGARLMEVVSIAGIAWEVTAMAPGTRRLERALKEQHHTPRFCPVCCEDQGERWMQLTSRLATA